MVDIGTEGTTPTTEKDAHPAFRSIVIKRCSGEHIEWEVVWPDGTPDRLHQGPWPNRPNSTQRKQLDQACACYLRRTTPGSES